jgi:hypothetical protein
MTDSFVRKLVSDGDRQQYLAKGGIGGSGVPFKLAELPVGEKA